MEELSWNETGSGGEECRYTMSQSLSWSYGRTTVKNKNIPCCKLKNQEESSSSSSSSSGQRTYSIYHSVLFYLQIAFVLLVFFQAPLVKCAGPQAAPTGQTGGNRPTPVPVNVGDNSASSANGGSSTALSSHPVVPGAAVHLFPRYGYLSLSMRVVPRNDTQNWIFLEPSKDVFLPGSITTQEQSFTTADNSLPLHNEFHIDLCEDVQQLIQAYFRRFIIDGLEKPWHAFAGGWRTPSLAKYFGIDPVFIKGDYRYMLVRVLMVRKAGRMTPQPNVTVTAPFQENLNSFRQQDYTSSFNFFNEVGTHYISSYLTGNSIYQVFVYDQQGYDAVKRRLSESGWVRSSYMAQLPYLLPLWVKHMGKVMLLNASPTTVQNVREALTIRFLFSVYPNIFKMHDNADLVRLVEKYLKTEPDGLLGLELKTLDVLFRDPAKRKWFIESLQQTMHLWEINLR